LPRKNSSKAPPRGGPTGRGGGYSGRGTTSPSPGPQGAGRGVTPPQGRGGVGPQPARGTASPSPAPQPVPIPSNTWAAKISSTQAPGQPVPKPAVEASGETVKQPPVAAAEPVQQPRKFSWATVTNSAPSSKEASQEPSEHKIEEEVKEVAPQVNSLETSSAEVPIVQETAKIEETNTTEEKPDIPSEHKNAMQLEPETSNTKASEEAPVPTIEEIQVTKVESADVIDNGNQTVIADITLADSNGNFATDDNENITDIKSITPVEHETKMPEEKVDVPVKLTNGDVEPEEVKCDDSKTESKTPDKIQVVENGLDAPEDAELPYKDDQWSPANKDGKKQYDRDFLMKLQTNPLSLQKPGTLPENMEVILNTPALENIRANNSAPDLNKVFDMTPRYIKSSTSHSRTPRRGDSRRKEPRAGNVKVINLPNREEVKLNEAENAWKPTPKKDVKDADDVEVLCKKIRSILNKLCPQKFDVLVGQFNDLVTDTEEKLTRAMHLVFEKAVDEPSFSVAYARMCLSLGKKNVVGENGTINFRALLLKRCQEEFQKDYMEDLDRNEYTANIAKAETEDEKKAITAEFEASEMKLRRRSLGNIRFIGELYKIKMLNGRIMHECIRKLLVQTDEESLECLCRLVTTVGALLEEETNTMIAKGTPGFSNLDEYFTNMDKIIKEKKTSSRVRFLMQDVIELRLAKWKKRREEAGPKTIEQIHEEAKKEELRVTLANMTPDPPPSRRSEDRSDRRRSQMGRDGRGNKDSRSDRGRQDQDWNNVPSKAAKIQEKVDPSKLKLSKVDINQMSFGPPGGSRPGGFGNWSRGSASASQANKKMSMQDPPALKQVNRFAMFVDDDGDSAAMPPPAATYHGRASEPAYRTGNYGNRSRESSKEGYGGGSREGSYTGRHSREGSYTGRHSREGSYSGRNSREGSYSGRTSREGGRIPESEVITEGVTSMLKGNRGENQTKLEDRTRPILAEYLHNVDLKEAFNCICELYHIETVHWLVEIVFNTVVEKKEKDRINAGKLLDYLLKNESLPRKEFVNGVNAVLEFAEDLLIDIPNFWEYFANLIGTILVEKTVDLNFLKESSSFLLANGQAKKYVSAVLTQMAKIDQDTTVELWQKSGLSFADFKVENCEQFIKDNKLDFLDQVVVNGVASDGDATKDSISDSLDALLSKNEINLIFAYIDEKFAAPRDSKILRTIVSRVTFHCIEGIKTSCLLNESKLREFGVPILKKYLDAVKSSELEALYSLQSLVNSLEHPNKLLHSIFDVLYDCDVISEDAFLEWEESTEPGEQEGKGVALKSCTQFFQWLKTAELEDDDEEQKVTEPGVRFTLGDNNEDSGMETDLKSNDEVSDEVVEGQGV